MMLFFSHQMNKWAQCEFFAYAFLLVLQFSILIWKAIESTIPVSSWFMPNTMLPDSVLFNIIKYYTGCPGKYSLVAQYISCFVVFFYIAVVNKSLLQLHNQQLYFKWCFLTESDFRLISFYKKSGFSWCCSQGFYHLWKAFAWNESNC